MTPKTTRGRIAAIALACLLVAALASAGLLDGGSLEVTQILNVAENAIVAVETATTALETAKTVVELENQITQDLDAAMGRIGALQQRFEDLSSDPAQLLEGGSPPDWYTDFTGDALDLAQAIGDMGDDSGNSLLTHSRQSLATADTVTRQRYARTFRRVPDAAQHWETRRERAERRLAADYVVLDSAERVAEILASASDSIERSRQQTELSETALAQEQRALQLTAAEVNLSVAQLTAHHAARNIIAQLELERDHREITEEWIDTLIRQRRQARTAQNRVRRQGPAWGRDLRLN